MNIFIDLDGPILDNSQRLYRIYSDLSQEFGLKPVTFSEYWNLKREHIPESIILETMGLGRNKIKMYLHRRDKIIESKPYLSLNKRVSGCYNALKSLSKEDKLILITTRKSQKNLFWELKKNRIRRYFKKILCGYSKTSDASEVKVNLIKKMKLDDEKNIIIGDTEAEIMAGKKLKMFSVGLTCGIRSKNKIMELNPDIICKDIKDVSHKIRSIKSDNLLS